ncbi:hypothetical protein VB711_02675 [Cronbergia sp. UHCC 0137]|uniref:hypothetical protein n=1 Tax=Cronbergia sp. UHCC 0137 TaxID=3110239 RepID=UPI002B2013C8|nr:hypothetical protein [Cronbergia sp. UHCC 0137]MEA5616747.1 hypothetical protein [Cronbergia sp. UHCC 0137]
MKDKKSLIIIFLVAVNIIVLNPTNFHLFKMSPALAQRISPSDVWQQVYKDFPELPPENQYISRETGKIAENNTLASRLLRYHIYIKGRSPIYRLDWKLTFADYLGVNETMYNISYPGNDTLKNNPIDSDRAAIAKLTRNQRNALIQVLINIFTTSSENTPASAM